MSRADCLLAYLFSPVSYGATDWPTTEGLRARTA